MNALIDICYAKAEHVQSSWQDANLAMLWANAGKRVFKGKVLPMTRKQIRRAAVRANLFFAIARGNKLNSQQLIAIRRMAFGYND